MKLALALCALSTTLAFADYKDENFSLRKSYHAEKTVIFFDGLIRKPIVEELRNIVKKEDLNKPIELRLNSVGGSFPETQEVIKFINELKTNQIVVNTRVDQGSMCASSCVPLFVQGMQRYAGNASSFMFHGVALLVITNVPSEHDTKEMIDTYRSAGINETWIQEHIKMKTWSVPSETWYNGKELYSNGSGFVTELLENQIFFKPYDNSFGSRPR